MSLSQDSLMTGSQRFALGCKFNRALHSSENLVRIASLHDKSNVKVGLKYTSPKRETDK